jgi:hypothetical protein
MPTSSGKRMIRWGACLRADRHHRSPDGKAYDVFEGDHPAVDDGQAGSDAARPDGFTIVAAEASPRRVEEREATSTDRKMAAFGTRAVQRSL